MLRILYLILMIFLSHAFILSSCERAEYPFNQNTENIVKVEVILMGELQGLYTEHEVTVIKEVSLKDSKFLDDFRKIECKRGFGDPTVLTHGDKGFKIIYKNGDYEIITYGAQGRHRSDKYFSTGYYNFDEEQFNDLVEKYSY
ncbi:MAG: hypothetical protein FD141_270 [Fusobacteria bacterium]|nr:MAG: hypothetical protein FD141_270 [Fusobacteriota bacterium]KAF0229066.1 MAG: hypothetical protein FD182_1322 [Fusobacteriota bacterium]